MKHHHLHHPSATPAKFLLQALLLFVELLLIRSATVYSQASSTNKRVVVCPVVSKTFNSTVIDRNDAVKRFVEISGLAISARFTSSGKPVMYAIADGGGGNRLGIWDSTNGKRLRTLRIPSTFITNRDWEAMAIGSCGNFAGTCLYIADVGDNTARTSSGRRSGRNGDYRIVKFVEPNWEEYNDEDFIPASTMSVLPFDYKHASSPKQYFDCEGTFFDHTGWGGGENSIGDFYIVTKMSGKDSLAWNRIFRIPYTAWPSQQTAGSTVSGRLGQLYSPAVVGTYQEETTTDFMNKTYRGSSMTRDGTVIALADKERNYLFLRCPGMSVADTLASTTTRSCLEFDSPASGQIETFAWDPNGMRSYQIPEGNKRTLGLTEYVYNAQKASQRCPKVQYDLTGKCMSLSDCSVLPNAWCDEGADFYGDPSILESKAVCGQKEEPQPETTAPTTSKPTASPSHSPMKATPSPVTDAPTLAPVVATTSFRDDTDQTTSADTASDRNNNNNPDLGPPSAGAQHHPASSRLSLWMFILSMVACCIHVIFY